MRPDTLNRPSAARPRGTAARRARILLAPVALALLLVLAAGCGARRGQRQPRVAVTVARVERRPMPVQIVTSGTIEPVQTANVGSQVGGVVQRIAFEEGQDVPAGSC